MKHTKPAKLPKDLIVTIIHVAGCPTGQNTDSGIATPLTMDYWNWLNEMSNSIYVERAKGDWRECLGSVVLALQIEGSKFNPQNSNKKRGVRGHVLVVHSTGRRQVAEKGGPRGLLLHGLQANKRPPLFKREMGRGRRLAGRMRDWSLKHDILGGPLTSIGRHACACMCTHVHTRIHTHTHTPENKSNLH